jgi:hypothetical protein
MKNWHTIAAIGLSLAIASSVAAPVAKPDKFVKQGKHEIVDLLNDPESARFKHLSLNESIGDGNKTLCGSFNAKNGSGGYGEFKLFFVTMTTTGKTVKMWTQDVRSESDFYAIDRQIARKLELGEIGELGAINSRRDARLERNSQLIDEIKEAEARCTAAPGRVKVIWKAD